MILLVVFAALAWGAWRHRRTPDGPLLAGCAVICALVLMSHMMGC